MIRCSQVNPTNTSVQNFVSLENQVQCPECTQVRFFKGQRGLKIHQGKCHKNTNFPLSVPFSNQNQCFTHSVSNPSQPFWNTLANYKKSRPVLKRIPRGARHSVATAFSQALRAVILENSKRTWEHLLLFPYAVLHVSQDYSNRKSLTTRVKENCVKYSTLEEPFSGSAENLNFHNPKNLRLEPETAAFKLVENKISDGDIKGAARILFSTDTLAPASPETLAILKEKHPLPAADLIFPDAPLDSDVAVEVSALDLLAAVRSFQTGSAGGLDGLAPQHLKDLLSSASGETGEALLRDLTSLTNLMLSGQVSGDIIDILYGANLCALKKKDGGIRPIAVGTTYRRLAAKICCKKTAPTLASYFQPIQLGFGSRGGCEAAVHSVRTFLDHNCGEVLLKVDVKNAFNSVDRGALLTQIKDKISNYYSFLWQCYGSQTKLNYNGTEILSAVGCQQGDPLGPAIFSLAIQPIIQRLHSKLNVWYLDDGTLGGDVNTVFNDLILLIDDFRAIGLELNFSKCELYISDTCPIPDSVVKKFNSLAPNIKIIDKRSLRLLGSPILDESFPLFFEEKIQNFLLTSERLTKINTHMAYTIIKYCLFVPKFTYIVRCCQLWKHTELLQSLDNIIKITLASVLNINLEEREWLQASLPVRLGGLGIRSIAGVALPAFLSSVYSTQNLINKILTPSLDIFDISFLTEARNAWLSACPNLELPKSLSSQRLWDGPLCEQVRKQLVNTCLSSADRARLLAVAEWESGLWLYALPSTHTGTLMDSTAFRVAACLRLGASCCAPHRCQCGFAVDRLGHHGLSCVKSAGRTSRHASLNDIIRRAFTSANCAAILEPNGLMRDDGKRPDGMTLVPWKMGRPLVWDATCVDTLAPSHLSGTKNMAGAAAESAERLKRRKYSTLDTGYIFEPFAVETLGPWAPGAHLIYKDLAKRLVEASRDQNAGIYLAQRLSIAIQRGNAASVLGTLPSGSGLLD